MTLLFLGHRNGSPQGPRAQLLFILGTCTGFNLSWPTGGLCDSVVSSGPKIRTIFRGSAAAALAPNGLLNCSTLC